MTQRDSAQLLKIGLVFDDSLDRPDGVQQYVTAIGGWLTAQGHEVHYIVGETSRTDLLHVHSMARNIGVRFNGNRLTVPLPASSAAIKQLLATEQLDILHIMMPYSPMMAQKVIRLAPPATKIVGTFHILPQSWLVRLATRGLGWWLRKSLSRFDQVFAVSSSAAHFAEAAFKLRAVRVSPNVVDLERFKRASPISLIDSPDEKTVTIMFLGRLVARKGCADLLKAVHELRKKTLSETSDSQKLKVRVLICGKGPQAAALQHLAHTLELDDSVEFTGYISEEDKPRYIAAADIMVFPSTGGESFGIVLIEAMASGRPLVLAASNPGYATVMEPRPDLLFKPYDYRELADKLQEYLRQPARRRAGVAWQAGYVKQFDVGVVGRQLEIEYLRLQKQA